MIELLAFGEVNPDIVVRAVPDLGFGQREDLVGPTTMTVGSSVAIMSCGAARLGTSVGLVGVIGDDPFGSYMMGRLADRDVDTAQVRVVPGGRTGSSTILVRDADPTDRHILTDAGVMGDLLAADVDLDRSSGLRHLHIGSWFLQTGALAALPDLLAAARARGLTTSVDPNDDPARTWDSGLPTALAHVDVLFCNEPEAVGIAANPDPLVAARALLDRMPAADGSVVVLKCGAAGAYAVTRTVVVHVAAPTMEVVDTVGAGDSLAAGYLTGRLRGASVTDALTLAVAAGSLSTRRSGGVDGQPTADEATALAATLTARDVHPTDQPRNRSASPIEGARPAPSEHEDVPL